MIIHPQKKKSHNPKKVSLHLINRSHRHEESYKALASDRFGKKDEFGERSKGKTPPNLLRDGRQRRPR
jgi:hypothetical protein